MIVDAYPRAQPKAENQQSGWASLREPTDSFWFGAGMVSLIQSCAGFCWRLRQEFAKLPHLVGRLAMVTGSIFEQETSCSERTCLRTYIVPSGYLT